MDTLGIYQILRDKNKRRKYGFIVPGMGRWDPVSKKLNDTFYDFICGKIQNKIKENDKILVIGLAESGLIAGYLVHKNLTQKYKNVSLALSSRESEYIEQKDENIFVFTEDHVTEQHPKHFLNIENIPLNYSQIIIIDDEMTTGITVMKLIKQIQHLTNNIWVFCYADVREDKFSKIDSEKNIEIHNMMKSNQLTDVNKDCVKIFNYSPEILLFKKNYNKVCYIFGECVKECLKDNYDNENSLIRIITHINWKKAHIIKDLIELGSDLNGKTHRYYNPVLPKDNEEHCFYYYPWQQPLVDNLIEWLKEKGKKIIIKKKIIENIW
tara:strand:+ start:658 stop:1629 length:972 start_codon:yes stop_codon:yes gene_type:complete